MKQKYNLKYHVAAGVILIIGGTLALLSDYIKEKRDVVFSEMNLALSLPVLTEEVGEEEINNSAVLDEEKPVFDESNTYEEYLGVIDIPKIGLYRGFYRKESSLNNVKFNLYVHPTSDYPDVQNGNLIIAGHSGNYNNSYFGNLYQLVIGDTVTIHYNNANYAYQIVDIYNEKKTGTVRIFRNKEKSVLTLITCTKDDESHQTIYIAELISIA